MNRTDDQGTTRRRFIQRTGLVGVGLAVVGLPASAQLNLGDETQSLRIGIIGSGQMGGSLGMKWAAVGHEIFFSSRNPDQLMDLVAEAGSNAQAGLPDEAAAFGDIVLIAVPYGALPQVGRDLAPLLQGKVVIELGNPREDRDGPMANDAMARGTGVASADYLPGVRLVRALNAIGANMVGEAPRSPDRVGVPIAGDDPEAVEITARLVDEAGFDPVVVGSLTRAREFDRGTEVYVRGMSAAELREALNL